MFFFLSLFFSFLLQFPSFDIAPGHRGISFPSVDLHIFKSIRRNWFANISLTFISTRRRIPLSVQVWTPIQCWALVPTLSNGDSSKPSYLLCLISFLKSIRYFDYKFVVLAVFSNILFKEKQPQYYTFSRKKRRKKDYNNKLSVGCE